MHMESAPRPQVFLPERMKFNRYVYILSVICQVVAFEIVGRLADKHRAEALP